MQFIAEHHAESSAGGQKSHGSRRIGHDEVETVTLFKRSLRVVHRPVFEQGFDPRLSAQRVGVEHQFGIAKQATAVRQYEQRVDLD